MDVVFDRMAGLDIGTKTLVVCVRKPGERGRWVSQIRTFRTMTRHVQVLGDWLVEEGVQVAAIESTATYWKPVYYGLEDRVECWLLNAAHIKAVPGRKTDVRDAEWITQLVEHGLVRPSFVPPPSVRRLRNLTRYRVQMMGDRTRHAGRLEKLLEDASMKLSSLASNITGTSSRETLAALVAGERDPAVMADMAHSSLRREFPHDALKFPDEGASAEQIACYISTRNDQPMRRLDSHGRPCHWILEVWAAHPDNGYAAFKEQLLDI